MRCLASVWIAFIALGATACIGEENRPRIVSWKQEVPLVDARKIVIERISEPEPGPVRRPRRGERAADARELQGPERWLCALVAEKGER